MFQRIATPTARSGNGLGRRRVGAGARRLRLIFCVVLPLVAPVILPPTPVVADMVVLRDDFTLTAARPDGSLLQGDSPDGPNLPGGTWSNKGATDAWGEPELDAFSGEDVARFSSDVGAAISLSDHAGYVKPDAFRLGFRFHLGEITGTSAHWGVGLGFYDDFTSGPGSPNAFSGFTGFVVDRLGNLKYVDDPQVNTGPQASVSYVDATGNAAFDDQTFHTLSYWVDTQTNEVSRILYDGFLVNFQTSFNALTDVQTDVLGTMVSSDSGDKLGYVDWLEVFVPAPGTLALMGAACLVLGLRRTRAGDRDDE